MSEERLDTHNLMITFGKYQGQRWTRLPVDYLVYIVNQFDKEKRAYKLAQSELDRRGTIIDHSVVISSHAINRASISCIKAWRVDRGGGEGLYSWLKRVTEEGLADDPKAESIRLNGVKIKIAHGNFNATVKTVIPDSKYAHRKAEEAETQELPVQQGSTKGSADANADESN